VQIPSLNEDIGGGSEIISSEVDSEFAKNTRDIKYFSMSNMPYLDAKTHSSPLC